VRGPMNTNTYLRHEIHAPLGGDAGFQGLNEDVSTG